MNGADKAKCWELYSKYIPNLRDKGKEWRGACPFYKEKTPGAFSISADTGQYFCHSCGKRGNAVTFARYVGDDERQYYSSEIFTKSKRIDLELVHRLHNTFIESFTQLPFNWDHELIEALKIGFDKYSQKMVFPIFDEKGNVINLKYHKGKQTTGAKISLYPLNLVWNYNDDYVVVCEGEKDCITLLSYKIQAVTGTGGAMNIPKDITALEKFTHIYICFDNDDSGMAGAEEWAQVIKKLKAPKIVHIADIGRIVKEGGDVTDYFRTPFKDRETFLREIIDRSRYFNPFTDAPDFVRRVMLSDRFIELSLRDQNVFTTLILRANRYFVRTPKIKGKNIAIGVGQYFTSIKRLQSICASDISEKQVRSAIGSLVQKGFITSEDLKAKRGRIITILGWNNDGQPSRQYTNGLKFKRKYPFLRRGMDFNNIKLKLIGGSNVGSINNNSSHKRLDTIYIDNNSSNSHKNKISTGG